MQESMVKPVRVTSATCPLCGKRPSKTTVTAENGGTVSACGVCARSVSIGTKRVVWRQSRRKKNDVLAVDSFGGGKYVMEKIGERRKE